MRRHLGIASAVGLIAAVTVACTPPTDQDTCPTPPEPVHAAAVRAVGGIGSPAEVGPSPLDQVIRPAASGLAGKPDLSRAAAAPARSQDISGNELTFTYNSPTYPWSDTELQQLQQVVATSYPIIKQVVGPPLFPITVNFRKDPTISSSVGGQYWSASNEVVLRILDPGTFVHEMIHAFRDDLVMWDNAFEEGMTRAAEVEVMGRMPAQYTAGYFDLHHSFTDDVNYEMFKAHPAMGSTRGDFWTDRDSSLTFLRYQLSGYAWSKAYLEDPQFLVRFDAALYQASLTDPSVTSKESALVSLAAAAVPNVESLPFEQWYSEQSVFDTSPPSGRFLLFRYLPPYLTTVHALSRAADGSETPSTGLTVDWRASDVAGTSLASGTGTTDVAGTSSFSLSPPVGYAGRLDLSATMGSGAQATTTGVRARYTQGSGVFGTVPRETGGYVEVLNRDTSARACATLAQGAFDVASLGSVKGRFTATVRYEDGVTAATSFNKDAGPYFIPFGVGSGR